MALRWHARSGLGLWKPTYISREECVANQERLHDKGRRHSEQKRPGRGAARQGAGLEHGLANCGACGHVPKVAYKPGVPLPQ